MQAVDGVSFTLNRGETLGIVGESGCGKSTVAKMLVSWSSRPPARSSTRARTSPSRPAAALKAVRRNIQMVFQDPYTSLNPRMTVGDIIAEPYDIHPEVAPKGDRRRGAGAARRGRAQPRAHQPLSAPVLRRPAPAHRHRPGLRCAPEIIVADEPVSALDVSVQAQVINLLERLQGEFGLSYIFIAHDLSIVRHISDRVGVMYLGRIVEIGRDAEIYDHPTHPYTQALLSAVPVPDPEAREHRERIILVGDVPSPTNIPSGCRFRTAAGRPGRSARWRCRRSRYPRSSGSRAARPTLTQPATSRREAGGAA